MIQIKDLLLRFQNLLLSEEIKIESVRQIISQIINVPLRKEDIKIKNNTVYLNIKPIFKNEILLKRDKIFLALEEALGRRSPDSIR